MAGLLLVLQLILSSAFGLCVSANKANLRAGPSSKDRVTWEAPKYTPLLKLKTNGSWYQVQDQDGEKHWVYKSTVSSRIRCVAVKVPTANLRTGPSASYKLANIKRVDKYTPFKRIDIADNGWYQLEAPWGGKYWMSDNLVWRPVKISRVSY